MQLNGGERETFEDTLEFDSISTSVKYVPSMKRMLTKKTDFYSRQH